MNRWLTSAGRPLTRRMRAYAQRLGALVSKPRDWRYSGIPIRGWRQRRAQARSGAPLAYLVIPPANATRDITALESTIQALALPGSPHKRAIALELVGMPTMRTFVVRGATAAAVANAVTQLQAQYPQAAVRPLPPVHDPLRLAPGEAASALELCCPGEPFLSLRTWTPRPAARPQEGADPLLGVLAALGQLPDGVRAMAQLALVPAPETWSYGSERQAESASLQRLRLDYGLRERERMQAEALREANGFPLSLVIFGVLGSLGWLLWRRLQLGLRGRLPWIPQPVWQALVALTRGQGAAVGMVLLALVGGAVLLLGVLVVRRLRTLPLFAWLRRRTPVYDPDRITTKAQQPAYRARLQMFVIGPSGQTPAQHRENQAQRALVLERMTAAYRQFHLAGGAYFTALTLSPRALHRLFPPTPTTPAAATPEGRRRTAWVRDLTRSTNVFSLAEVATLWHLPQACDVTDLAWLRDEERAHTILAPPALAIHAADHLWPGKVGRAFGAAGGRHHVASMERSNARGIATLPPAGVVPATPAQSTTPPGLPLLGASQHAGEEVLVQAPPDLLTRHTLAVAKTGKGKSTLLLLLARLALASSAQPAEMPPSANLSHFPNLPNVLEHAMRSPGMAGAAAEDTTDGAAPGLMLLDPHGDLAQAFLGLIPPARREDVLIVDLADTAYPVALNPLDVTLGRDRDKAVENLLQIFAHIWAHFWGPRMENALEFALKTLYEANHYLVAQDPQQGPDVQFTLLDVAPILSIPSFRHRLLSHVSDPHLLAWWAQYFEPLDLRMQLEIINPVLTKLAKFSGSQVARRIVGQGRSTLDLARVVRDGQVLLVNIARGHVGADTAALIGATLLGLLRVTLEEQSRAATGARRRVVVLVDEFQTVPGADYGTMLAELRKFGASFVLATQALAQLDAVDRALRPTVLANVDNLFTFAVSAEDARLLVRELDEVVTERDLINLPPLTAYAKLSLLGRRLPVFSVCLDPPLAGDAELRRALVQASRARIARPAAAADALLAELSARHTPPRNLDTWVRAATQMVTHARGEAGSAVRTPSAADGATRVPGQAASADGEASEPATGRGRRTSRRRRTAADPLAIVGIPPRWRGSTRTPPFAFAPAGTSDMDADLRPFRGVSVTADAHEPSASTASAQMALPWQGVAPHATGESTAIEGGADGNGNGDEGGEHEGSVGAEANGTVVPRPRKRQRGSRGGGGRKARASIEPDSDSGAEGPITTEIEESGRNGVMEVDGDHV